MGGLLGQLEGRGWGETCVYNKCVVLVLGPGSGFFRRLLPSALCPLQMRMDHGCLRTTIPLPCSCS